EDGIRDFHVTGVQTCALPIFSGLAMISDKMGRPKSRLVLFRNPKHPGTLRVLKVLAIAEMAGDKFPFAPDRTALGPLLGRAVARSEERRGGRERARVGWRCEI